jgi:hypothetical protein
LVWLLAFSCYTSLKKWYLSLHRLARSLTNQSCGTLLIWNGTLFSKMAPWCGQVRGHSLLDKKFFPIPATLYKIYWYCPHTIQYILVLSYTTRYTGIVLHCTRYTGIVLHCTRYTGIAPTLYNIYWYCPTLYKIYWYCPHTLQDILVLSYTVQDILVLSYTVQDILVLSYTVQDILILSYTVQDILVLPPHYTIYIQYAYIVGKYKIYLYEL